MTLSPEIQHRRGRPRKRFTPLEIMSLPPPEREKQYIKWLQSHPGQDDYFWDLLHWESRKKIPGENPRRPRKRQDKIWFYNKQKEEYDSWRRKHPGEIVRQPQPTDSHFRPINDLSLLYLQEAVQWCLRKARKGADQDNPPEVFKLFLTLLRKSFETQISLTNGQAQWVRKKMEENGLSLSDLSRMLRLDSVPLDKEQKFHARKLGVAPEDYLVHEILRGNGCVNREGWEHLTEILDPKFAIQKHKINQAIAGGWASQWSQGKVSEDKRPLFPWQDYFLEWVENNRQEVERIISQRKKPSSLAREILAKAFKVGKPATVEKRVHNARSIRKANVLRARAVCRDESKVSASFHKFAESFPVIGRSPNKKISPLDEQGFIKSFLKGVKAL